MVIPFNTVNYILDKNLTKAVKDGLRSLRRKSFRKVLNWRLSAERLFDQQNRRESSKNPRPPTPRNPRNARFTRSAEMPDHPDLPEFADQISLALPAEFQSDPKIPRFTRFCRSEIATLLL